MIIEKHRELALNWWKSLTFEHKFTYMVKYKEYITGYPDRPIDTLTGREIEIFYSREHTR